MPHLVDHLLIEHVVAWNLKLGNVHSSAQAKPPTQSSMTSVGVALTALLQHSTFDKNVPLD